MYTPQVDIFGRATNIAPNRNFIGSNHVDAALKQGVPWHMFHGGAGAAYRDTGVTGDSPVTPTQAGGGIVIIADEIDIQATAQTENLYAEPETQYASGEARTGPSAGGLIMYVGRVITIDDAASYEMGTQGIGANKASLLAANLAGNEPVAGAATGQCFTVSTETGAVTRIF